MRNEFLFTEAPFASCHAPTVAVCGADLVVAWFGGTREGAMDTEIWIARRTAAGWEPPVCVTQTRFACWNPVLCKANDELLLFYRCGRSPSQWSSFWQRSSDNGRTFGDPNSIPAPFLGPIKNKALLLDDHLLCPSSREDDGWHAHLEWFDPSRARWSMAVELADPYNLAPIQPTLLNYGHGRIQALVRTRAGVIGSSKSLDRGATWSAIEPTELKNPNSGIDATVYEGTAYLVYNPVGVPKGRWGGARTPLSVARSRHGREWQKLLDLEAQPGEYSYPAIVADDHALHIVYSYRRRSIRYVRRLVTTS